MNTTLSSRAPARRLLAVGLVAAFAVAGAAFAQSGAAANPTVTIKNFDFSPMALTVPVGATVTWKNLDEEPHTVTSLDGLFRSGALDEGEHFSFKFTKPGVYRYLCSIHTQMTASVTVK